MTSETTIGKRERVARALYRSGMLRLVMKARSHVRNPLSVLTYHSIADHAEPGFDQDVVDATPAQFEAQLRFVGDHYTVVGIDDVIASTSGGAALPKNPLLITFDDGYRSCIDTALPMLAAHGLRATFFIATDYVEERRIYWWDKISYLVRNARNASATLSYPHETELDLTAPDETIASLLATVKQTRDLDLPRLLEELTAATGTELTADQERVLADRTIMTWDDVRALRDAGMDVQSHTRTHRVLQTLDDDALDEELRGSRLILERELGQPVRTIAYPVGVPLSDEPRILAALDRSGYALGFTNTTGMNYPWTPHDRWNVKRFAVTRESSIAMFAASLAVPPLGYAHR